MYGIKLCVFTSVFLCCPGGKWQMSGSRVGLSAPLKSCCYILEVLPRSELGSLDSESKVLTITLV